MGQLDRKIVDYFGHENGDEGCVSGRENLCAVQMAPGIKVKK